MAVWPSLFGFGLKFQLGIVQHFVSVSDFYEVKAHQFTALWQVTLMSDDLCATVGTGK